SRRPGRRGAAPGGRPRLAAGRVRPRRPRRDRARLRHHPAGRAAGLPRGGGPMSLRVAYVCADPGIPVFGTKGASVHVQEIIRAWRARGAEVHVYAVRLGDEVPVDLADLPVHLVRVGGKGLDPAQREVAQQAAAAELARQVVELAPDVVYERYSLFSCVLEQARQGLGSTVRTVLEVNAPLVDEQRTHRVLVDEAAAVGALRTQLAAADVV